MSTQPQTGNSTDRTPGDLARRVRGHREALGLTVEQVAERARMDPDFVRLVERQPVALTGGALIRLADALDTTASDLLGAMPEQAPGHGRAALRPRLEPMDQLECWHLLERGGVGRIAFTSGDELVVLPVNCAVHDGRLVIRTAPSTALARHADGHVTFEIDRIDDGMHEGWSVMVAGRAEVVTEPSLHLLAETTDVEPWAGGPRDLYVVVRPDEVTGRRIRAW